MLGPLTQVAAASLGCGRFEVWQGEWPRPIESRYVPEGPVLSTMVSGYRHEGRVTEVPCEDFIPASRTFFLPAGCHYVGRGAGGPMRVARCVFSPERFENLVGRPFRFSREQISRCLNLESGMIRPLMTKLAEEVCHPGLASEMLMESVSTSLMIECARQVFADAPAPPPAFRGLQRQQLERLDAYLDSVEIGAPRVPEMAAICGLSNRYFANLFREATGQTPARYIVQWRMRRAKTLLMETGLPLKEIAYRLGFTNEANFCNAFRKAFGQPPGAFRRQ